MAVTPCSECDEEIDLSGHVRIGRKVVCPYCGALLEVIATDPLELDLAQEEGEDGDDDWDDDFDDFAPSKEFSDDGDGMGEVLDDYDELDIDEVDDDDDVDEDEAEEEEAEEDDNDDEDIDYLDDDEEDYDFDDDDRDWN